MLIVYEDEYAMEEAENEKGYKIEGFPSYFHSGLSPPMKRVVQRRFRARFEERESKPIPPPPKEVSEVERGIQELIAKLSAKPGKQKKGGGSSAATSSSSAGTVITTKEKVIEEVEDEIVDYEPWMGEGGIIYTVEDAKKHPEWWLTKEEMKEIEMAKKAEEDEMLRKMEKAEERKKRKKEKKQKKMEGSAAAEASLAPSESSVGLITKNKKKGIPSIKSRPLHPSSSVPQEEPQPIDDVEEAARALTSAEGGDDFLFELENDDMFDFDNEDITSLI
jgi:transcription initiation factor TFIID subunit 7